MAKKKSKNRKRNGGLKIPIAVVAGFVPGVARSYEHWQSGWSAGTREMGRIYLGYDWWNGTFNWKWMLFGMMPIVLGTVVHKIVGGKLGVNRAIAGAGIPVIRL